MNETGFRIFHSILRMGASITYAVTLALFMKPFLTAKEHPYKKTFFVFLIHFTCWRLCSAASVPQGILSIILPAVFLAASGILKLKKSFCFLLVLLYCNARISSGLITESLYFIIEKLFPLKPKLPSLIYLYSTAQTALFCLTHIAVLAVMLYALQRQIRKRELSLQWQELCYMSLIPVTGILFGQMVSRLLFEVSDGIALLLYERHPVFLIVVPLLALLFYAGSFFTIAFQQGTEILRKEREEYFVSLQQTRAIQDKIQETELFYNRFGRMKHELRGHLINIKGLSQNGQYEELKQYIARMDESIRTYELSIQTGNAVTDVIINDKRQQCMEKNIDFHVDFHYPASGQYDAFDLGIILQNLLSNALEACENTQEGNQYISLTSRQKRKFFLIKARNSFTGEIRFAQNGLPETTKPKDRILHGIGLSNVRRETEKYMGELELTTDNHEFCATVLLQERSNL